MSTLENAKMVRDIFIKQIGTIEDTAEFSDEIEYILNLEGDDLIRWARFAIDYFKNYGGKR